MRTAHLAIPVTLFCLTATLIAQKTRDVGPTAEVKHDRTDPNAKGGQWPVPQGAVARPKVMLVGYWPPTNEMLRPWSTSKTQNTKGWIGSNWGKLGFDVYAYFPEFPRGIGKGVGDFEVDYQDTTSDFWRITKAVKPTVLITFSRGFFGTSWEIELNANNHKRWVNDYLNPRQPNPSPPDKSVRSRTYRRSTLPAQAIFTGVKNLNISVKPVICAYANGGTFLSEFLSYHGLWYQGLHRDPKDPDWCVAAGHIHVGTSVTTANGTKAVEATLRAVLKHANEILAGTRQPNMGLGGPGTADMQVVGQPLTKGKTADLTITGLPGSSPVWLLVGGNRQQLHVQSRLILPTVPFAVLNLFADQQGKVAIKGIRGVGVPLNLWAQAAYPDFRAPAKLGMTNAVMIRFLR